MNRRIDRWRPPGSIWHLARRACVSLALAALASPVMAQAPPAGAPQPGPLVAGLCYYAVQNPDTGSVILRGKGVINGVSWDNLILAPKMHFRAWVLEAATLAVGSADFTTSDAGGTVQVPDIILNADTSPDSDNDGLNDTGEMIVGTDPHNPDTNADGIKDGPEVLAGLDPLGGLNARVGIIASASTAGPAVDVSTGDDLAAVAEMDGGVAVFNIFNGMVPTLIAQVSTPKPALRVAGSGRLIAVAEGDAGLAIVDVTDPPAAAITHQVPLGTVKAVAAAGGVGYAGTATGQIAAVDLSAGVVLGQISVAADVRDLAVIGDYLYALLPDRVLAISTLDGDLELVGSAASPINGPENFRLFPGRGVLYATQGRGVNVFSLSHPDQPAILSSANSAQPGWRQAAVSGSGLAVAIVGTAPGDDVAHDLSLYDFSDPKNTNQFITTIKMPAQGRAVATYNGLAYVADDKAGLQVVNYLAYDSKGVPPTIKLVPGFDPTAALEGTGVWVAAIVTDDVQVRNVEFDVDGSKIYTAGSLPFEVHLSIPSAAQKSTFQIRARASDTGGNSTWSDPITVTVVKDTSPLHVIRTHPAANGVVAQTSVVSARFSRLLDPASVTASAFQLFRIDATGPGKGTPVPGGVQAYAAASKSVSLTFSAPLEAGIYRASIDASIRDTTGQALTAPVVWTFYVIGGDAGSVAEGTHLFYLAFPFATTVLPRPAQGKGPALNSTIARPPATVVLPGFGAGKQLRPNLTVARPPVTAVVPGTGGTGGLKPNTTVAKPPVTVKVQKQ